MRDLRNILYANLACGDCFIDSELWLNLDYCAFNKSVRQADLLNKLPCADESVVLVYSSHFLEHIPYYKVSAFLSECYRILKENGIIRLVVPDLENICREYLKQREKQNHDKADFCIIELLDQCVRTESGGQLGKYYRALSQDSVNSQPMIDYVKYRTGEIIPPNLYTYAYSGNIFLEKLKKLTVHKINQKLINLWIKLITSLLPSAFRDQNISYCNTGEKHAWMWDFYTLSTQLAEVGFRDIKKLSHDASNIPDFPLFPLDMNADGTPRKGYSSMYVEAVK